MNSIALLILIIGVIFITLGYNNSTKKCPPKEIEYRFIPRTFYDEQMTPTNIKDIFSDLFNGQDNWLNRYNPTQENDFNWQNFFSN